VKSALLLGAVILLLSSAVAQNRPAPGAPPIVVFGAVEGISGKQVYVKSELQLFALTTDEHTEIWKGKEFHDLSPLEVGDEVIAKCRRDASGNLIAEMMRLNGVNVAAVITKVAGSGFEVLTNPNADPQSGYRTENRIVSVDEDTLFEESAREDLRVGRNVQVIGLDLKNGTIRATRVTVYEGHRPVRMGNARIILPNGQIR
jgi:hypothetical protein